MRRILEGMCWTYKMHKYIKQKDINENTEDYETSIYRFYVARDIFPFLKIGETFWAFQWSQACAVDYAWATGQFSRRFWCLLMGYWEVPMLKESVDTISVIDDLFNQYYQGTLSNNQLLLNLSFNHPKDQSAKRSISQTINQSVKQSVDH